MRVGVQLEPFPLRRRLLERDHIAAQVQPEPAPVAGGEKWHRDPLRNWRARAIIRIIEAMLQPAAAASACLAAYGATACTDVTGFGLLGHLLEMLSASKANARLDPDRIPALDGAMSLLRQGLTSSLHAGNSTALESLAGEAAADPALTALLIDPQTAGGLLAGVPAERAADCLAELHRLGYRAAEIGIVAPASGDKPRVWLEPGCVTSVETPLVAAASS